MGTVTDRNLSRGIVTPEAVLLDFEVAGVGTRLLAQLIDLLVIGIIYSIASTAFVPLTFFGGQIVVFVVVIIASFLLIFGYAVVSEVFLGGRTVGKMALGLRVVSTEGAPVTFGQAAIRSIMTIPDMYMTGGGAAIISVLLSTRAQRLGDLAAGTMVIRDLKARRFAYSVQFPVPHGFEPYAARLDVTRLSSPQYHLIRSFLARVAELRPEVRASMADLIAQPVGVQINHHRPASVHPETFLACVASRYQQVSAIGG